MKEVCRVCVCQALNKLFSKLPPVYKDKDINENAGFWVAELADTDITVEWNEKDSEFF